MSWGGLWLHVCRFFSTIYQIAHIFTTGCKCYLHPPPKYTQNFDASSCSSTPWDPFQCWASVFTSLALTWRWSSLQTTSIFLFLERCTFYPLLPSVAPNNLCPLLSYSHFTQFVQMVFEDRKPELLITLPEPNQSLCLLSSPWLFRGKVWSGR